MSSLSLCLLLMIRSPSSTNNVSGDLLAAMSSYLQGIGGNKTQPTPSQERAYFGEAYPYLTGPEHLSLLSCHYAIITLIIAGFSPWSSGCKRRLIHAVSITSKIAWRLKPAVGDASSYDLSHPVTFLISDISHSFPPSLVVSW